MGGIRPNNEGPIICSLAKKAAIWIAFQTPGLQLMKFKKLLSTNKNENPDGVSNSRQVGHIDYKTK